MNLHIDSLVVEVTRRCNMKCEHCLRGEPQNKSIKIEYVNELFSKINSIGCVTFTGGEPSLVPHIIRNIMVSANHYGVDIGNFYIVTNAKKVTPSFLETLTYVYNQCTENEISSICYSNDRYHENQTYEQLTKLEEWAEYEMGNSDLVNPRISRDSRYQPMIIREGRAGWGEKENKKEKFRFEYYGDTINIMDEPIYLNCNGYIIAGYDWSYESQNKKEHKICHVNDFSTKMVAKYNRTIKGE